MKSEFSVRHGLLLAALFSPLAVTAADPVDFNKDVRLILEANCLSCHGPEKPKGDLRLDTRSGAITGGEDGPALVPGKPAESPLYTSTLLPPDHDDVMPPKGEKLSKQQTELLRVWIEQGAAWPEDVTLAAVKKVDFVRDIQPILEMSCVACHREGHDKGGLRLETRELAMQGGEGGPGLIPGKAEESPVYKTTVLAPDHDDLMPPSNKGGPLPKDQTDLLRDWINQGAVWPEGVVLVPRKVEVAGGANEDQLVSELHRRIVTSSPAGLEMKAYTEKIPGAEVTFEMLPIPGGEFIMGSPDNEPGRKPDEGPQHKVKIEPFWMGKCEVTWNEYEIFMFPSEEKKARATRPTDPDLNSVTDAVTRPTTPYVEMSFGMGKDGFPAISMTQHAANSYCKWLSAKTGHFYRLPTEAEWEYACRAGTTTVYSFGNDVSKLGEYAWFEKNSDWKYQKVGKKKPNPWGLHDMHGNVIEWTLDQYDPDYYKQFENMLALSPWNKATKPYPHVARGGSWDDTPDKLRSSARRASNKGWKVQDPQLPKSIWFHTDAQFLGFRVIRPLRVPAPAELSKYWTRGVEKD
jgi:formylglycine-generating enzyme required for sulfatase activity/mono/diheme cytochrome c family protein